MGASEEVLLQPGEISRLGPIFFSPLDTGKSYSVVYVRNNLTGLETVVLLGEGAQAKVTLAALDEEEDTITSADILLGGHWDTSRVERHLKTRRLDSTEDSAATSVLRLPSISTLVGDEVKTNVTYLVLNSGNTRVTVHGVGFGKSLSCSYEDSYGTFRLTRVDLEEKDHGGKKKKTKKKMSKCPKNQWTTDGETLEPGEWRAVSLDFNATCYSELTKAAMVIHLSHGVGKGRVERFDETQVYGHVMPDVLYKCAEERAIHHWSSSGRMLLRMLIVLSTLVVGGGMSLHILKDYNKAIGGSGGGEGTDKPLVSSPPSGPSSSVATVTNASKRETESVEEEREKKREDNTSPSAAAPSVEFRTSELLIEEMAKAYDAEQRILAAYEEEERKKTGRGGRGVSVKVVNLSTSSIRERSVEKERSV
jgi:hypothetical protein